MKCPKCAAELPDDARFCSRHGRLLQAELIAELDPVAVQSAKEVVVKGRRVAPPDG